MLLMRCRAWSAVLANVLIVTVPLLLQQNPPQVRAQEPPVFPTPFTYKDSCVSSLATFDLARLINVHSATGAAHACLQHPEARVFKRPDRASWPPL